MYLWTIVSFVCVLTGTFALHLPSINGTFTGYPTGPCFPRCTCQENGRYFSLGERWTDPQDRCTVYECHDAGSIRTIHTGCNFKGLCKDVNSTWTEACISYTCDEGHTGPAYRLISAGCQTEEGTCKMVGERSKRGCVTEQCQFGSTGRLSWAVISTGCTTEGECKMVNTYWHDGCTIYTCNEQSGVTKTEALTQDIMYWPDGNYILFKPKTGCPIDIKTNWADGSRKHHGIGQNSFPAEPYLAGQFTPAFFSYEFCSHTSDWTQQPRVQRYDTVWQPGHYCIFRSQGLCPRGFSDGYLHIDDHDAMTLKADRRGAIPDGIYDTDTAFYFCCRNDGQAETDIILPKENNFALMMGGDVSKCQKVKGMNVSEEKYTIDGSLFSKHELNGSLPKLLLKNGDLTFSVCLYQPLTCGCPDGTGAHIPPYGNKTINCINSKCVSGNGTNRLEMISGGCEVEGACRTENDVWSDVNGDSCTKLTCRRLSGINGTRFQIQHMFTGCRDGDMCLAVGTEVYKQCSTRKCLKDEKTQKFMFKTIKSDCPWMDTCQQVNSTFRHGCMTYKCENVFSDTGYQQWNVQPVQYGCNGGSGRCYEVGENITGTCYEATCRINSNKSMVYMDVTKGGCLWKEVCKSVNTTWRHGCHTFQCKWVDSETGFTAVINATHVSCEWKGKCYNESATWSESCIDYTCIVQRQAEQVNWSVETTRLGCRDTKGNCVALGKTMTDRCVTYECKQWGDQLGLDTVSVGCQWRGKCRLENSTWENPRRCVTYQCSKKVGSQGGVMQISVVDYDCAFNGTCKKANSTWPDGCRTRMCNVTREGSTITRSVAPITAGCDDEGLCRPIGYKKVSNSCMEYECLFNDEVKDAYFTLTVGACRSLDNKCHKVNTKWTDKTSDMCLDYVCRREKVGYLSKMILQQCRDASGVCRPIGAKGFPATVNGILKANCQCVNTLDSESGIAIQCKP